MALSERIQRLCNFKYEGYRCDIKKPNLTYLTRVEVIYQSTPFLIFIPESNACLMFLTSDTVSAISINRR